MKRSVALLVAIVSTWLVRVLPQGVPGQPGIKSGPYLKYIGGPLADTYVRLGAP